MIEWSKKLSFNWRAQLRLLTISRADLLQLTGIWLPWMGQIKTQVSHLINKVWHHPNPKRRHHSRHFLRWYHRAILKGILMLCLLYFPAPACFHVSITAPLRFSAMPNTHVKNYRVTANSGPFLCQRHEAPFSQNWFTSIGFFFYPPAAVWSNGATMWQQQGSVRVKPSLTVGGVPLYIYIYQLVGLSEKYNKLFNNVSLQVIAILQRDLFNTDRTKSKELVNITEMPEIWHNFPLPVWLITNSLLPINRP